MPELIELAGGVPTGVAAGAPAKAVSAAELASLAPEVVLVKPCGFSLERALRERGAIEAALAPLFAAGARAYASDGNAYFNRPGPRLVESLEILAACVHPEGFAGLADKHKAAICPLGT
jgi:iron complex transport system substrate-binding protein